MPLLAFDKWYVHCATLGFIGRIKFAPGTFGSIPGVLLAVPFYFLASHVALPLVFSIISILLVTVFAWYVIHLTEQYWQQHDRSEIVIDELAGQFIPIMLLGIDPITIVLSFITFRFFDILKPWPVGHIDSRWPGAAGTLFDDTAAGILSALTVFCLQPLLHF